jgi:hypothetical protein
MQRAERWGTGQLLNEAQALDLRTGPAEQIVFSNADHEDMKVHVSLGTPLSSTGISCSILRYGKPRQFVRLFSFVYAKQDGRWQALAWQIFDVPNGKLPWQAPLPSNLNAIPPLATFDDEESRSRHRFMGWVKNLVEVLRELFPFRLHAPGDMRWPWRAFWQR